MKYHEAFKEAQELAQQLRRPVQIRKNAFGYSVSLFPIGKDGQPLENVGQIVHPPL